MTDTLPNRTLALLLAAGSLFGSASAAAQQVTAYSYDALGRVTNTSIANGANNGVATATQYDPATNRTSYVVSGVPVVPSGPTVANFSFEQPAVANYQYGPFSTSGSTFSTRAGVAANGGAWGFATPPNGSQVAFLQSYTDTGATITLDVSGLTPGQSYAFRYSAAQRPGFSPNAVTVGFSGTGLGTFTAPSTAFTQITTNSFTASAATGQVTFSTAVAGSDVSSGIDNVTVIAGGSPPTGGGGAPGVLPHYSFEMPYEGSGFEYRPNYYSDLYFQNGAGIAGNGSAWGFVTAPAGNQVAFFQDTNASVSTNVSGLTVGASYTVKFKATKRPGWPANQVYVSFQGNNLGYYTPTSDTAFQQFTTGSFTANAATGVLTIVGLTSGPTGTGVDDIQITSP